MENERVVSDKEKEWLSRFSKINKDHELVVSEKYYGSEVNAFVVRVEVKLTPKLADTIDRVVSFNKEIFENRSTFLRSCAIRYLKELGDWQ